MSSWSFVSDDAFLKVLSVGRKDCKCTLHNINPDLLHNSNKNSRYLYKMDTNSVFPVHILSPEIKLQEFTCLLIVRALSFFFMLLFFFHSIFVFKLFLLWWLLVSQITYAYDLIIFFCFWQNYSPHPTQEMHLQRKQTKSVNVFVPIVWGFFYTWVSIPTVLGWMCSEDL